MCISMEDQCRIIKDDREKEIGKWQFKECIAAKIWERLLRKLSSLTCRMKFSTLEKIVNWNMQ